MGDPTVVTCPTCAAPTTSSGTCVECAIGNRRPVSAAPGRRRDVARGGNPRANPPCLCHCPKANHSPWSPTGERVGPCEAPGCVDCTRYRPDGDDL